MKTFLAATLLCFTAVAQPVEVVTSTSRVETRTYLAEQTAIFEPDAAGTNVTTTAVNFRYITQQRVGDGTWIKISENTKQVTTASVTSWPLTYTNALGATLTNNLRTSVLATLGRVDLLPGHAATMLRVPQAIKEPEPVVVVPEPVP